MHWLYETNAPQYGGLWFCGQRMTQKDCFRKREESKTPSPPQYNIRAHRVAKKLSRGQEAKLVQYLTVVPRAGDHSMAAALYLSLALKGRLKYERLRKRMQHLGLMIPCTPFGCDLWLKDKDSKCVCIMYVYMCIMYMQCLKRPRGASHPPGTGVTAAHELPCGC